MDFIDVGKSLSRSTDATVANNTTTISGIAMADSSGGVVTVQVAGVVLELSTTFSISEGDTVIISNTNHDPVVTGVVGKGDEQQTAIDSAQADATAASYSLAVNCSSIERTPSGELVPATLYATAYVVDEGENTAYVGRFIVSSSTDGTTYSTVYSSSADESAISLALSTVAAGFKFLRIQVYEAGGTSTLLKESTLNVVDGTGNFITQNSDGLFVCSTEGDPTTGNALKLSDTLLAFLLDNVEQTKMTSTGVIVGPESGVHVSILSSGEISMYSGATKLFDATADGISLGVNSISSVIKMCKDSFEIAKYTLGASTFATIKSTDTQLGLLAPIGCPVFLSAWSGNAISENGIMFRQDASSSMTRHTSSDNQFYGDINAYDAVNVGGMGYQYGRTPVKGDGDWIYAKGGAFTRLCTQQSESYPVYGGRIINTNISVGTINLSEAAENFNYIEIYYGKEINAGGGLSCSKYYPHGDKSVMLYSGVVTTGTLQVAAARCTISGTSIVKGTSLIANINTDNSCSAGVENNLVIYRVVGYR